MSSGSSVPSCGRLTKSGVEPRCSVKVSIARLYGTACVRALTRYGFVRGRKTSGCGSIVGVGVDGAHAPHVEQPLLPQPPDDVCTGCIAWPMRFNHDACAESSIHVATRACARRLAVGRRRRDAYHALHATTSA